MNWKTSSLISSPVYDINRLGLSSHVFEVDNLRSINILSTVLLWSLVPRWPSKLKWISKSRWDFQIIYMRFMANEKFETTRIRLWSDRTRKSVRGWSAVSTMSVMVLSIFQILSFCNSPIFECHRLKLQDTKLYNTISVFWPHFTPNSFFATLHVIFDDNFLKFALIENGISDFIPCFIKKHWISQAKKLFCKKPVIAWNGCNIKNVSWRGFKRADWV